MLGSAEMIVEFDAAGLDIGKGILNKLGKFPPSIWSEIESEIKNEMQTRAAHISSFTVRPKTVAWRKSRRRQNKGVSTHKGVVKLPNDSDKVGDRTHTFLTDLKNSQEPGIVTEIGTSLGPMVVENGSFRYGVELDAFAEGDDGIGYPHIFQKYLVRRGIVPKEGILALEEAKKDMLLKNLGDAAWREIRSELGAYGGAASIGNKIVVNVKKLFGKVFRRGK